VKAPTSFVFPGESPGNTAPKLTVVKGGSCDGQKPSNSVVVVSAASQSEPSYKVVSPLRRQQPEGIGPKLYSVSILTDEQVEQLGDEDLQRYIASVARAMYLADAVWDAEGCFDAKGQRDRLWTAEQVALRARWKRPHLVAQREADIAARMTKEPGAPR
jgi:hypothetical protein